ncbi:MAG: tetratricopeptide repeat protein [Chloroflexi bacterium]|nr:tetratricopeptide repeat protein [Chloroflexota bacterium]
MNRLNLTLLGMPQIKIDDQPITNLPSRKARALLIYLALTRQTHSRQHLAGFLWGEMTEDKARRNLRVLLTRLRKQLEPFLNIQRRELGINLDSDVWIDVDEFEACLAPAEPTLQQLHRAAKLYQGHFLDGFALRDALLFEEWQRPLQERYRQLAMDALYRLAVYHTQQKQYGMGIDFTGQLLGLEPWMEEAHRQMMLLQALSGQRTAALTQYETCRDVLMEEIGVEPSEATTTLYQQILNEEIDADANRPAIIPSTKPISWTPPFQPPAVPPHFVGRTTLQDKIISVLKTAVSPQIHALVGMGGVGKSALANQLAYTLQDDFVDGILWANVAASEPMSILESWAQLYGYDFTRIADVESMAAAFRGVLADKSVLIVLDDVTSAARIRPLLPTGDHNHVLLTARDQDLAHALHAKVWPLEELSQENGRLLFSNILGEERVQAEPDAAADICTLLQNLPLAVEITAQRLKSRPRRRLVDMAARLDDETKRLSLLKISDQGVRASFGISWETLDGGLRQVFQVMGLFNGRSFTADAIAHIVDQDPYLTEDRIYTLTTLSLVSEEGQTRYRQHALLADFAREKLEDGEMEGVNGRLAQHYLQFAQRHPHDYDILRPEWDNLMAAMETAHTHQLWQTVIDFADALHDAWFTRGRFTQARKGYQWSLEAAAIVNNSQVQANINLQLGRASIKQSDYAAAEKYLTNGLHLFESRSDQKGIADINYEIAEIATEKSDFEKAQKCLAQCLSIRQQQDDNAGIATVIYKMADIEYALRNAHKAQSLGEKALTLRRKEADISGSVQALRLLASIATSMHNFEISIDLCQQALVLCEEIKDKQASGLVLYNLSFAQMMNDELDVAYANAEKSLDLFVSMGNRRSHAQALWTLSQIDERMSNYHAAKEKGVLSLAICEELGDKWGQIFLMQHLGDIYINIKQLEDARGIWLEALTRAKIHKHPLAASLQERIDGLDSSV